MARNKYPGRCYCCGQWIEPGYGHFERVRNARPGQPKWRIKCVKCASGRVLTDKDPGVIWAKKAVELGEYSGFPRQIQKLRERRGMSRKALGECCGLSKNMIGMYERGERVPSLAVLVTLADFFGVSVSCLLDR